MNSVGYVRRMDELGRLVIPRELRKKMKLDEGIKMQFFLDDENNIVIKKVSEISIKMKEVSRCIAALSSIIENDIIITDREHVIASSNKKFLDIDISTEAYEIVRKHDTVIKKRSEGAKMISPFDGKVEDYDCELFVPILSEGDSIGSIIVLAGAGKCFNNDTIKICKAFASLIGLIEE